MVPPVGADHEANPAQLVEREDLGAGDVLSSPVGLAFLKTFIFPEKFGEVMPRVNWQSTPEELKAQLSQLAQKPYADVYKKELQTQTRVLVIDDEPTISMTL